MDYPENLKGLTLDQVNYHLEKGLLTEADAVNLMNWWNNSGKRFTNLILCHFPRSIGGREILIPYLKQVEGK